MGLNPSMNRVIEPAMADDRFDFFIGSMHTLDNQDVASTIRRMTGDFLDYYLHYYEEMFPRFGKTAADVGGEVGVR